MPPDLSSEERESTSERSLHHSIMVNGTVLSPSLGTSGNPSKSPHFVMVREEDGTSYKHPNKIRKRNKSGRRSLHSSKGSTDARYLNGSQSPQYGSLSSGNKPLKVTIRRTALSHTLDNRKTTCNPDHDAYSSSSPSNSVIYSSSSSSSHCVLKAAEDDHPISVTPKPTSQSGNPSLSGAPSPSSSSLNLKSVEAAGADLISTSPSIHSSVEPPTQLPATDQPSKRDASTSTRDCATITEPDLLGPCEPGSKIVLEGIVWLETPGMMVINAHWRGRAYLGTLLDASKNTLGPSCPDKMVSALSLFRGRQNWGSGGYYRASSNSCSNNQLLYSANIASTSRAVVGTGGVGAAMTTRAAAAAAAAAERTGTDEESGSNRSSGARRRGGGGSNGGSGQRGGTKRKRRRGSATHTAAAYACAISPTSAIKVGSSQSPTDITLSAPSSASVAAAPTRTAPGFDQCDGPVEPGPAPEPQTDVGSSASTRDADQSPFVCPQPGCEKRFADMVGLRYHLDMGHMRSSEEGSSAEASSRQKPNDSPQAKPPSDTNQQQQRQPPRLAKAKTESATSLTYADDDQPPPQLDRGPGAEEELGGNEDTTGTDLTEPPAASPAYSDISDDAASPLNPVIVVDALTKSTTATTVTLPAVSMGVPLQSHRPPSVSADLYHNGHTQLPPPHPPHPNTPDIFTAAALAAAAKAAGGLSAPCQSLRVVSGLPQPPPMAASADAIGLQRSSPLLLNSGAGHTVPSQRVASPSAGNFFLRGAGLSVSPDFASHPQMHRSNLLKPHTATSGGGGTGTFDFAQQAFPNLPHSDGAGGLNFQSVRSCLPMSSGGVGVPVGMVPFARLVRPIDGVEKRFPLCPSSISSTTTVTTGDTPNHMAASVAKTCPLQYMNRQSPPQPSLPPSVQPSSTNAGLPFRSQ